MTNSADLETAFTIASDVVRATGFLPALDDERIDWFDSAWPHSDDDREGLETFLGTFDANDSVARCIATGVGWRLTTFETLPWQDSETRWAALRNYVSLVTPQSIASAARMRWEIHAAASSLDLARVLELARRWEDLEDEGRLSTAARTIFLLVRPGAALDILPSGWVPGVCSPKEAGATRYWECHTFFMAAGLEPQKGDSSWKGLTSPIEPREFDKTTLDALHVCHSALCRLEQSRGSLTTVELAMRAWCDFALGTANTDSSRLTTAGARFVAIARDRTADTSDSGKFDHVFHNLILHAAGICHAAAGRPDVAETWFREAIAASPEWPNPKRKLTECLLKQDKPDQALAALADYSAVQTEGSEELWLSPFTLKLGFDLLNQRALATALELAAYSAHGRPLGEGLVRWYTPWFDAMSHEGRKRWWFGHYVLAAPEVREHVASSIWDEATSAFGEAVAIEFKVQIFEPFSRTDLPPLPAGPTGRVVPQYASWEKALKSKAMLGEMVDCLLQTRQPNHDYARRLNEWLTRHCPRFMDYLRTPRFRDLSDLGRLRGEGQHDTIDEQGTRRTFRLASDALEQLFLSLV